MPSELALLTGLTYKGTDLQAFPRIFLEIVEGGPDTSPEVRGGDRRMPYRRGQIYGPRRADRLPIQLKGYVAGDGANEVDQRSDTAVARQELYTLFDVEGGEGTLLATTEDGTVWTIEAYPEVFLPELEPVAPTHWGVSVRLIAIDPPNWTVVP
jgi:hypothetical protein